MHKQKENIITTCNYVITTHSYRFHIKLVRKQIHPKKNPSIPHKLLLIGENLTDLFLFFGSWMSGSSFDQLVLFFFFFLTLFC